MKRATGLTSSFAALAVAFFAASASGALVYQNTTGDLNTRLDPGTYWIGDQIGLAGTDRNITFFSFQYYLTGAANASAQVRFYRNDGALYNPLDPGSARPSTVLFDSGIFTVTPTTRSSMLFSDFVTGAATALTTALPNEFTWTVQFSGVTGGTAGVDLYSPPAVGYYYNDYWQNDGTVWTLRTLTGFAPGANFGAAILAVPEPSTYLWSGLLGVLVGGRFLVQRIRKTSGGKQS